MPDSPARRLHGRAGPRDPLTYEEAVKGLDTYAPRPCRGCHGSGLHTPGDQPGRIAPPKKPTACKGCYGYGWHQEIDQIVQFNRAVRVVMKALHEGGSHAG